MHIKIKIQNENENKNNKIKEQKKIYRKNEQKNNFPTHKYIQNMPAYGNTIKPTHTLKEAVQHPSN